MKQSLLYAFIVTLARWILKIFYRMRVYGLTHYCTGGAILAPNHASYFDPPLVAAASPEEIHLLARESLFRPLFGRFISALNTHPIQGQANNLKALKTICELLEKGYKVLIFPEGTRSKEDKFGEIKPGITALISRSKTAIIPIYIHGSFHVWNRNCKWPRLFGRMAVVFGSPIQWKDYTDMDQKEARKHIVMRLEQAFRELRKWYESGAVGTPP